MVNSGLRRFAPAPPSREGGEGQNGGKEDAPGSGKSRARFTPGYHTRIFYPPILVPQLGQNTDPAGTSAPHEGQAAVPGWGAAWGGAGAAAVGGGGGGGGAG